MVVVVHMCLGDGGEQPQVLLVLDGLGWLVERCRGSGCSFRGGLREVGGCIVAWLRGRVAGLRLRFWLLLVVDAVAVLLCPGDGGEQPQVLLVLEPPRDILVLEHPEGFLLNLEPPQVVLDLEHPKGFLLLLWVLGGLGWLMERDKG